jgi:hypothetical protein
VAKETNVKHAPDAQSVRLPTVLTAPMPRLRDMPVQEIVVWTPSRAIVALSRGVAEFFGRPVPEAVRDET